MRIIRIIIPMVIILAGCAKGGLTKQEKAVISGQGQVMRVLTVDNREDSLFLRGKSIDFSDRDMKSRAFRELAGKMVSTVTDPSQDGVGIAGPQVGLARRIIAVQRFDKEGEPFEVYPNVRIESFSGDIVSGQEGCLSVPGERGSVPRYSVVVVSYKDPLTLRTVRDTVEGFTAVIFQHETDHLDGILYTDRADSLWVDGR
ncbi:MAG: peptide deformylase [Bacteroidales bacterium]|nr:peptide deformylase [Bacteroidales bacterium]